VHLSSGILSRANRQKNSRCGGRAQRTIEVSTCLDRKGDSQRPLSPRQWIDDSSTENAPRHAGIRIIPHARFASLLSSRSPAVDYTEPPVAIPSQSQLEGGDDKCSVQQLARAIRSSFSWGFSMSDGQNELPTLGKYLSQWLGFQLPSVPFPHTRKNVDKALSQILLAGGQHIATRIRQSTRRVEARGSIDIENMFRTEEEKNKAAVARVAIEQLGADPGTTDAPSEIEDDWLKFFARFAEDKSSEELQTLFGKILAGEIKRPGSFSLRSLQLMALISRRDAADIITFLSYVIGAAGPGPGPARYGAGYRRSTARLSECNPPLRAAVQWRRARLLLDLRVQVSASA
jgi:hypothetical protein